MRIRGMGLELPSRKVSNDDVLAEIAGSGHDLGPKAEKSYLQVAGKLLAYSGAQTRYWLADDERPVDLLQSAIDEALADADLAHDEVDLFIYAAVSRGFLEPAESFTLAKSTGLDPDDCFDVLEACNSFSRATDIAQMYLETGRAKNALIAVGEFCVHGSSYVRATFKPGGADELGWRLPAYTLGEGATAVVLEPGGDHWNYRCHTDTSLADACVVALPWASGYAPDIIEGPHQTQVFRSYAQRMHAAAVPASLKLWEQFGSDAPDRRARTSILFPHAPSRTLCERFSEGSGFPFEKIFQLYTRLGNIGSGSVPMGLYLARQEGRLRRGDQVACLVGAAGMSFMLYDFVF